MVAMRAADIVVRARRIYRGWLIVAISFLAAGLTVGTSGYAFGLFIQPLETEFGWSRTAIGASLSFLAIGSLISPLVGRLMDQYGARPVMVVSTAVFALSFILRPFMTELWHWYALSVVQALGFSGAAFLPAGRLIAIWFRNNTGRVMGITTMGNNFGGAVMPVIAWYLISNADWKAAFVAVGVIGFVLAALAQVIVKEFPAEPAATADKESGSEPALTGFTVQEALRSQTFYLTTVALMLGSFTYSSLLPWVSAHLATEGMADTLVPRALAALAIMGMLGKFSFGYMAEKITARYAMMASFGGQIVSIVLMVAYPLPPAAWIIVPFFGFCMGGFGVLITLIVQQHFGIKAFGSISGLTALAAVIPSLVGPLIAGASADLADSYAPSFLITAALFAVGAVVLTQVGRPRFYPALA